MVLHHRASMCSSPLRGRYLLRAGGASGRCTLTDVSGLLPRQGLRLARTHVFGTFQHAVNSHPPRHDPDLSAPEAARPPLVETEISYTGTGRPEILPRSLTLRACRPPDHPGFGVLASAWRSASADRRSAAAVAASSRGTAAAPPSPSFPAGAGDLAKRPSRGRAGVERMARRGLTFPMLILLVKTRRHRRGHGELRAARGTRSWWSGSVARGSPRPKLQGAEVIVCSSPISVFRRQRSTCVPSGAALCSPRDALSG